MNEVDRDNWEGFTQGVSNTAANKPNAAEGKQSAEATGTLEAVLLEAMKAMQAMREKIEEQKKAIEGLQEALVLIGQENKKRDEKLTIAEMAAEIQAARFKLIADHFFELARYIPNTVENPKDSIKSLRNWLKNLFADYSKELYSLADVQNEARYTNGARRTNAE